MNISYLSHSTFRFRQAASASPKSRLALRAANENPTTHLLVESADPGSLLSIPSPASQNLSSARRAQVSVVLVVCVRAQVWAHIFLFATHFTQLSLNTFFRTIAATSPRFRVRDVCCARSGLGDSVSHGTSANVELCCMHISEQMPELPCGPALYLWHYVPV